MQQCIEGHEKDPKRHVMLEGLDKFRGSAQGKANPMLVTYWEALEKVKKRILEALALVRRQLRCCCHACAWKCACTLTYTQVFSPKQIARKGTESC
jgi:hypothetical protein